MSAITNGRLLLDRADAQILARALRHYRLTVDGNKFDVAELLSQLDACAVEPKPEKAVDELAPGYHKRWAD